MKKYTVHVILSGDEKEVRVNAYNDYQAYIKAKSICEQKGYASHDIQLLFVESGW